MKMINNEIPTGCNHLLNTICKASKMSQLKDSGSQLQGLKINLNKIRA